MAKAPLKKIAVSIEDLISKIDRSALPAGDEEAFKTWLSSSINSQTTVETALRKGFSVKASQNVRSKKLEYWIQIVTPES
ncbi:MAG: hypothetical protein EOO61_15750 [Hymenobacter sp.]|nr:MAG: hypothetical protein EOO61_15750 [Hymenobacter sp.]